MMQRLSSEALATCLEYFRELASVGTSWLLFAM